MIIKRKESSTTAMEKVIFEGERWWFMDSIGMRVGPFSTEEAAYVAMDDHIEFQSEEGPRDDAYGDY